MDDSRTRQLTPLVALRARLQAAAGIRALRGLLRELEADGRAGAHALAVACRRRLARERADARRIRRMLARRRQLRRDGVRSVAGCDEVGVGPLAGPLVAAAVVLPDRVELPRLDDSKRLDRATRERLAAAIHTQAVALGIGVVSVREIERWNVYRAGLEAMRRAVAQLDPGPDHVLVDARTIPGLASPQTAIVGGDAQDASIAAASIVAKVHRDGLMRRYHRRWPVYGFDSHMGYATEAHRAALRRHGPCPIHRKSFAPVSQLELW